MELMNCPRGVGRQKKKRFGAPSNLKSKRKGEEGQRVPRIRKKMSLQQDIPTKSLRQRAEEAAFEDMLEEDSEDCLICFFSFNNPIKRYKEVTRCPTCSLLLHEPCPRKSGCISVIFSDSDPIS